MSDSAQYGANMIFYNHIDTNKIIWMNKSYLLLFCCCSDDAIFNIYDSLFIIFQVIIHI
jgi:hypothetical protein